MSKITRPRAARRLTAGATAAMSSRTLLAPVALAGLGALGMVILLAGLVRNRRRRSG